MNRFSIENLIDDKTGSDYKFKKMNDMYITIPDFKRLFDDLGIHNFTDLAEQIFASDNIVHIEVVTKICITFGIPSELDFKDWQYNDIPFGEHLLLIRDSIPRDKRLI